MATEKWVAGSGVGFTWSTANTSSTLFNALASGNALISDLAITNQAALDIFCDISWLAGGTATTAAPNFLGFYLYPLGQDGATYGDGRFTATAAGPPPNAYEVGAFSFAAAASTTIAGVITGIIMPPGTFKFLVYNQSGVALASTNVFKYRTYNRSVA